jgi:hypothetical protein
MEALTSGVRIGHRSPIAPDLSRDLLLPLTPFATPRSAAPGTLERPATGQRARR